jgi:formiminotetrahydrofolate cyclodeaminase
VDFERLAAESAGVAAARVVEIAAAVLSTAARMSAGWAEAAAVAGQADSLRRRATRLAAENAPVYAVVLRAFEQGGDRLGQALDEAAEVPLRVAEAAHDVVLLAAHSADRCEPQARADVIAAGALAAGAAAAAAELVASNLTAMPGDERVERARDLATAAAATLRR